MSSEQDAPSQLLDQKAVDALVLGGGFTVHSETSAVNGRGVGAPGYALSQAIDWDGLSKTTRPELSQRIQNEIERKRQRGDVVLPVDDLHRSLGNGDPAEDESLLPVGEIPSVTTSRGSCRGNGRIGLWFEVATEH